MSFLNKHTRSRKESLREVSIQIAYNPIYFTYIDHNDKDVLKTCLLRLDNDKQPIKITDLRTDDIECLSIFVERFPDSIFDLDNPDKELIYTAIRKKGSLIEEFENPDIRMMELALITYPSYIRKIPKNKLTLNMCIILLKNDAKFLRNIKKIPLDMQMRLVEVDSYCISYINNPYKSVKKKAIKVNNELVALFPKDEDLQMYAVKLSTSNIAYIKNPCLKVQEYILNNDVFSFSYIRNPDIELFKQAIDKHHSLLIFYTDIPVEVQKYVLETYKGRKINIIKYIKYPHPDLYHDFLDLDPTLFSRFKCPDLEVSIKAWKKDKSNFKYFNLFPYINDSESLDKLPIELFRMVLDSDYYDYLDPIVISKCKKTVIRKEYTKKKLLQTLTEHNGEIEK